MKIENKLIGAGVLSAVTASLCCLTPLLALIAGTSGLASTFSWLEPFRPYTSGLAVLFLGYAWYRKANQPPSEECACETDRRPDFFQSKPFLGIATVFTLALIIFPYYSSAIFNKTKESIPIIATAPGKKVVFTVKGMTCTSCEGHIDHELTRLKGIVQSTASFDKGNAVVEFDDAMISVEEVEKAINSTGYAVTAKKEL